MKVKNISYPYPVLNNEDDIAGKFSVRFSRTLSRDNIELKVKTELENSTIEKLIKSKKAVYVAETECGSTFYRKTHESLLPEFKYSFPADSVRGLVTVKFYIRASVDILGYVNKDCHSDYVGFAFDVSKGDILAVGGITKFIAEKEFDPLKPAVSSFMAIKESREETGPFHADFDDNEKIIIRLPKKEWNQFRQIRSKKWLAATLHASIVLPVLAEAITYVHNQHTEYSDSYWYERLSVILHEQELATDDPLVSAQQILKEPLTRAFEGILAHEQEEDEYEDV